MRKRVKQRGHFGRIKGINENKHFFDNILCSKLLLKCTYFSNTKERILKNASLEGKNGLMLRVDILAIINRPVRLRVFLEHTGTGCSCCSTSIYFKDSDCSSFHSFSLHWPIPAWERFSVWASTGIPKDTQAEGEEVSCWRKHTRLTTTSQNYGPSPKMRSRETCLSPSGL